MTKTLNRRAFLKVTAAGGAFLIGGYVPGLRESGTAESGPVVSEPVRSNAETARINTSEHQPTRFVTASAFLFLDCI